MGRKLRSDQVCRWHRRCNRHCWHHKRGCVRTLCHGPLYFLHRVQRLFVCLLLVCPNSSELLACTLLLLLLLLLLLQLLLLLLLLPLPQLLLGDLSHMKLIVRLLQQILLPLLLLGTLRCMELLCSKALQRLSTPSSKRA